MWSWSDQPQCLEKVREGGGRTCLNILALVTGTSLVTSMRTCGWLCRTTPRPPLHKGGIVLWLMTLIFSLALALVFGPPVEGLVGLVEGVFEVIVLGIEQRLEGDLLRLGNLVAVEEAQSANGFEPHARVLVVDLLAQQLERIADPVAPVAEHAGGGGAGTRLGTGQQLLEKRRVDVVQALVQPECLEHLPPVLRVALVEPVFPFVEGRQDFLLGPLAQLAAGAIAGAVFVRLEEIQAARARVAPAIRGFSTSGRLG